MAQQHIQEKQPTEIVPSTMDFVKRLPALESITTADVKVYDSTGADVSASMVEGSIVISGSKVSTKIKGGLDGQDYKITFQCTTLENAYEFEEDVQLKVREI